MVGVRVGEMVLEKWSTPYQVLCALYHVLCDRWSNANAPGGKKTSNFETI